MKAYYFSNYLAVPFTYGKDGKTVMLFIPKTFIENGDTTDTEIRPENLFGVDIRVVWDEVKAEYAERVNEDTTLED